MGLKYPGSSISGYNASPPADDGTSTESNKVKYATVKTKLSDPSKVLSESINTDLIEHFNNTPIVKSADYTVVAADFNRPIEVSNATTITLGTMASLGSNFSATIVNVGSSIVTVDPSGSETILGSLTYILNPKESITIQVNLSQDDWIVINDSYGSTVNSNIARLNSIESLNTNQNSRLDSMDSLNTAQDNRLTNTESVADAAKIKNDLQDSSISSNIISINQLDNRSLTNESDIGDLFSTQTILVNRTIMLMSPNTTTGSGSAYVVSVSSNISPAYSTVDAYKIRIHADSLLNATININSAGIKIIKLSDGITNLRPGDLKAGFIYEFLWDGVNIMVINPSQVIRTFNPRFLTDSGLGEVYAVREGVLIRTGTEARFQITIIMSSIGTRAGAIRITDLPYPLKNYPGLSHRTPCLISNYAGISLAAGHNISGYINPGGSAIFLQQNTVANFLVSLQASSVLSNFTIRISGSMSV